MIRHETTWQKSFNSKSSGDVKVLARIIEKIVCETKLIESNHHGDSPGPSHSQVTVERTAESMAKSTWRAKGKETYRMVGVVLGREP